LRHERAGWADLGCRLPRRNGVCEELREYWLSG
jgi:hypothetical protein